MEKLTQSLEDYLEAIYVISLTGNVARVKEVAEFLDVKTPSVVDAIGKLSEKGLVVHEKYGYLELTDKGCKIAEEVYDKHKKIYKFLNEILGVSNSTSKKDACNIEHYISKEAMTKMIKFSEFVDTYPGGYPKWLKDFNYYVKHGHHPENFNMEK
ncbi:MAG: metal-dependent transcriptional regulator [Actinomycetota bacterium]|nr:metal-dependent transcriptional regulator [Actinomycetota bacterium]MDD5601049.1 metal-dependent transcriptional regulator [Actinomycetota bacterium]